MILTLAVKRDHDPSRDDKAEEHESGAHDLLTDSDVADPHPDACLPKE